MCCNEHEHLNKQTTGEQETAKHYYYEQRTENVTKAASKNCETLWNSAEHNAHQLHVELYITLHGVSPSKSLNIAVD